MKSFKLREEKSFIKILQEPVIDKPKVNWSRRAYLGIFLIILFSVIKHVYRGTLIIHADGQVELPKQTINFQNDVKLLNLFTSKGDAVCQGDTLFAYQILADEIQKVNLLVEDKGSDWIIREKLSIGNKIEQNSIMIQNNNHRISSIDHMIELRENMLLSGLHEEYDHYTSLKEKKQMVLEDNELLLNENKMYKKYLYQLNRNLNMFDNVNKSKLKIYDRQKYFVAPVDGIISDIFHENNEICYKKSELMTIHQLRDASISTYFDPEEVDNLDVGDVVKVRFPDGSSKNGLISNFYISTYALPSEFQKKYEPTERNIVAKVIPMSKTEEQNWRHFYKMNVKVEKQRTVLSRFTI